MVELQEINTFEEKPNDEQSIPKVNRKYKDTLFRRLFSEKKNLLELYNALCDTSYTNENKLEIVTLENAIYMNIKNDVAFLIADYLNMFEHQSTKNPNMPLRDLLYIAREYEKLINRQLYRKSTQLCKKDTYRKCSRLCSYRMYQRKYISFIFRKVPTGGDPDEYL